MIVAGRLTGANRGYAGHAVELSADFPLADHDETLPLLIRSDVADDGTFAIEPPVSAASMSGAEVIVRGPAGAVLARKAVTDDDPLEIEVKPQRPVALEVQPDLLAASLGPFEIRVVVVDDDVNEPATARLVSVWGRPADGTVVTVLAANYTDGAGSARLAITRRRYEALEVRVPGTVDGELARPVVIDQVGVPESTVRIVTAFVAEVTTTDNEDCGCEVRSELPRTPDQTDLVEADRLYATDLANGTCPSPAVANRTLEEYRFYSLVRSTDPFLKGVKPKRPRPLSDVALEVLAELSYGFGGMDNKLARSPGGGGDTSPRARALESSSQLDQARHSSDVYYTSGLIAAKAWARTASADEVRKQIIERARDLSEDALRHALSDPDGFTPVSLMTAERFSAIDRVKHQLRLFHDTSKGRELVSTDNMPRWDEVDSTYQAATIAHGHVLEWRQVWRADGYSLGDLLYSLPLAPGQKRKIAIVDWDRGEASFRSESRAVSDRFSADLARNRTVSEVVNSTVTESIDAGSRTNTWAAGGGLGLGIPFSGGFFGLGVAGGGGGSSSTAWQNSARSLAASAGQQLSDRTTQASAAVRSQRASVVVGAQQSEGLAITSEVVANYNHCHAMTMEYFEVLQHFRVDQELAGVSECLFIPLVIRPFDIFKALRWRDILRPRLRRRRWAGGFDAMERILRGYADTGLPSGRYADEPITELSGELRLQLSIARPRDAREDEDIDTYLDTVWDFWQNLFGTASAKKAYDATIDERDLADRIFADAYAPRVARAFCDSLKLTLVVLDPATGVERDETLDCDVTMVSNYRPGGLHLVSFRATSVPASVTRAMIRAVRIESDLDGLSPNSTTVLRMASIQYSNDYRQHRLVPTRWMSNDILDGDHALLTTRSLTRSEELNPREEDRELFAGLIKHLNEFVEHYHHVIWWRMDPNRRFMLLDGFIAPNSGGRSLASAVENRLLSIVGNALVMPVAPGFQLDPLVTGSRDDDGPIDLLEAYRPPIPFPPKRISLPTQGVHGEAILGECNSCEIRDDTRFWDWTSEPIPNNEAPEIAEISTASRRQTPADVTPTEMPAPIVAIQNTPAVPDPVSIGALASLLGQEDLFKDVTGLEQNQLNAIGAFQQSLKTANAFGKMAASGAKASFANRGSDRVLRKVREAESSGLLGKDDATDVVGKLFGVMNGEPTDPDTPLAQESVIKKALESVNASSGEKSIKVSASSGSTNQTVEAKSTGSGATEPAVNIKIAGVSALKQPSPLSCWAVALTMLVSHARQQSLPVETVLLMGGEGYLQRFRSDTGLPIDAVRDFRTDFQLDDVSFGALTAKDLDVALRQHGPLWVIADEDSSPGFSVHARVVTGVVGDGTPVGTKVFFNDPATGNPDDEQLNTFTQKLDQLSQGVRSAFGGVSPTVLAL